MLLLHACTSVCVCVCVFVYVCLRACVCMCVDGYVYLPMTNATSWCIMYISVNKIPVILIVNEKEKMKRRSQAKSIQHCKQKHYQLLHCASMIRHRTRLANKYDKKT